VRIRDASLEEAAHDSSTRRTSQCSGAAHGPSKPEMMSSG
jgi:hypothetical protein